MSKSEDMEPNYQEVTRIVSLHWQTGETIVALLASFLWTYSTLLLICSILLVVTYGFWQGYTVPKEDESCPYPLPPGSMGLPVLGETLQFVLQGLDFHKKRMMKHGNIFKTHFLGRPTIRVIGAQNVRKVLMSEHKLVTSQWPTSAKMLLGMGTLSMSSGAIHKNRRRSVCKAFSHDYLCNYIRPLRHVIGKNLEKWCKEESVLAYVECKRLAANIATDVLLGMDFNEHDRGMMIDSITDLSDNIFSLPISLPGFGFRKGMKARTFLIEAIEKRVLSKAKNKECKEFKDALSIIMEELTEETDLNSCMEELKELSLEFMFAGLETTASAFCSLVMYLAQRPDVLEKLFEEMYQLGLVEDDSGDALTYDVLNKMKYANCITKEILRLTPPIGGGFRQALQTFEIGGYQIPKGWTVLYSIRDTQNQSSSFQDIDEFQPERWENIDEHEVARKSEYIPFGGGSRACAGKEFAKIAMKVFAIELARGCSWRLTNAKPEMKYFPVPHPVDNLPIIVREMSAFRKRAHTV